jgi:N-acylneuraminate cytidylyltransferase
MCKVLAIVPARSGSQGIKDKNLQTIAGVSLLNWAVRMGTQVADRTVVTSDSDTYLRSVERLPNIIVLQRPSHLAESTTKMDRVVAHVLDYSSGFDWVLLLQPTSPLRKVHQIKEALERRQDCISVTKAPVHPHKMFTVGEHRQLIPVSPSRVGANRQSLPQAYLPTGDFYIVSTKNFRRYGSLVTPESTPFVTGPRVDIDDEDDLAIARFRCSLL